MSTFRELVYIVIDELKIPSDDAYFTEEHIMFLLSKFRSFFIKKTYSSVKKQIPDSAYQTVCIDLHPVELIPGICEATDALRSTRKIPTILPIGNVSAYPVNYFVQHQVSFVPRERFRYVGHNRWLQNEIYASIAPDGFLYLKSSNPQFRHLATLRLTAIFEDAATAAQLSCDATCDPLDSEFPLEDAMIMPVVELVVQELRGPVYSSEDKTNNATDDKAEQNANQVPQNQNLNETEQQQQ